jgi:asparagine synthase (glutamine-hydrolysing)
MSALAGVFGPAAGSSGPALDDMFAAMKHRASTAPEVISLPGLRLVAARHSWEASLSGWAGPLIAADDNWIVAADATLYYQADLRRKLRDAHRDTPTSQLILMSLHAWGPRFASRLEGDYAIVVWDRQRERLLLARDFGGRRQLAYATVNGSVIIASSASAVVRHPLVSAEYDVTFIAASACAVAAHGPRTAFRDVAVVPGGATLAFDGSSAVEVDRWKPPAFRAGWYPEPDAQAAEQLRALIEDATRERIEPSSQTTVWMSGGWDSPSVFGAGMAVVERDSRLRPLLPISISYPREDFGNEDHFIRSIAEHWSRPLQWIESSDIPLFADSDRRAGLRDDPMPQPFESTVRALSRQSRVLQSRVALEGVGGDHLFLVSGTAIVADHLFYGRWPLLWRELRAWRMRIRPFARAILLPNFSPATLTWIGAVRGRPLAGYWDRPLPNWIVPTPELVAETRPEIERRPDESAAEFESRMMISGSLVQRATSWNHAIGLDEGVQPRGPLFDQRVISFAASRPLSERGSGGDSKRILRRAMASLLPDSVLATRTRKTGTPSGYFRRQLQESLARQLHQLFDGGPTRLGRLGILDESSFRAACDEYYANSDHSLGALLHMTLETERWVAVLENGQ